MKVSLVRVLAEVKHAPLGRIADRAFGCGVTLFGTFFLVSLARGNSRE